MNRPRTIVGTHIVVVLGLVSFIAAIVGLEHAAPGAATLDRWSALVLAAIPVVLWLGNLLAIGLVRSLHHGDPPVDGLLYYMMAAGIGFAATRNYDHLVGLGGPVMLSRVAMTTMFSALAHGCGAGILGHVVGAARRCDLLEAVGGGSLVAVGVT